MKVGEDARQEGVAKLLGAGPGADGLVHVDRRKGGRVRTGDLELLQGVSKPAIKGVNGMITIATRGVAERNRYEFMIYQCIQICYVYGICSTAVCMATQKGKRPFALRKPARRNVHF